MLLVQARLNSEAGGGAWCPREPVSDKAKDFLQIDLGSDHVITGLITQGRFAQGLGQEFAEFYILQTRRASMQGYQDYRMEDGTKILQGNHNTFTPVKRVLARPVIASMIRILPYSVRPRTVCMRVEVLGCRYHGRFFELLTLDRSNNNDITTPEKSQQTDDWNEATFLGAAVGILVTVVLAALAAIVLVLVRNRGEKSLVSSLSRYSLRDWDTPWDLRAHLCCCSNIGSDTSSSLPRESRSVKGDPSPGSPGPSALLYRYNEQAFNFSPTIRVAVSEVPSVRGVPSLVQARQGAPSLIQARMGSPNLAPSVILPQAQSRTSSVIQSQSRASSVIQSQSRAPSVLQLQSRAPSVLQLQSRAPSSSSGSESLSLDMFRTRETLTDDPGSADQTRPATPYSATPNSSKYRAECSSPLPPAPVPSHNLAGSRGSRVARSMPPSVTRSARRVRPSLAALHPAVPE